MAYQDNYGGDQRWGDLMRFMQSPGSLLVFADDTSVQMDATTNVSAPVEMWAAVVIDADDYDEIKFQMAGLSAMVSADEMHFQEICNPKRGTFWHRMDMAPKIRLVAAMCRHASRWIGRVYVFALNNNDHLFFGQNLRFDSPPPRNLNLDNHKQATEFFFHQMLYRRLRHDYPERRFAVVSDLVHRGKVVWDIWASDSYAHGNGVFYVDSKVIRGVQLADLVCYAANRNHRAPIRAASGRTANPFDEYLVRLYDELRERGEDLLALMVANELS